jgi:hypothetical protein
MTTHLRALDHCPSRPTRARTSAPRKHSVYRSQRPLSCREQGTTPGGSSSGSAPCVWPRPRLPRDTAASAPGSTDRKCCVAMVRPGAGPAPAAPRAARGRLTAAGTELGCGLLRLQVRRGLRVGGRRGVGSVRVQNAGARTGAGRRSDRPRSTSAAPSRPEPGQRSGECRERPPEGAP